MTDLYTPLMYVGWLGSLDDSDMDMDICWMDGGEVVILVHDIPHFYVPSS